MVFSSLTFLFCFLPITFILYFLVRTRAQKNLVLLAASIFFYAWGEPFYVFLIVLSTINDYVFSNLVQSIRDEKKWTQQRYNKRLLISKQCSTRRRVLEGKIRKQERTYLRTKIKGWNWEKIFFVLSVVINLGLLGVFKYTDFIIANMNTLFGLSLKAANLPLPIGISFYTFQTMSYSIDVYMGKVKAQKNFWTLATYVALFPQLIAGPIVRYQTIEEDLVNRHSRLEDVAEGLRRFLIGLAKKVLIANQMGLVTDAILITKEIPQYTVVLWLAAITYSFQIYFDFSGYSDMAIGLGRVFGFRFLENFRYPYMASSITDFWRRWHISLGSWFRDYVYIPLGGNQKHQYFNIAVVWFFTGLWHGASWNYVLWGSYYGILLIMEKLLVNKLNLPRVIKHLITLVAIICGWMIFRLEDVEDLKQAFYYLWHYQPISMHQFITTYNAVLFALPTMVVAAVASVSWEKLYSKWREIKLMRVLYDVYLICLFISILVFLTGSTFNPFIYFRF